MTSNSTPSDKAIDNRSPNKSKISRSRSEIESAINGGSTIRNRKPNPSPVESLELHAPPRRQQVLGGNLTGVYKRPKFGVFSRHNNISIMNWVALVISFLILAAFLWPQENKSTQETISPEVGIAPNLGETDLSEDEQIEFLEYETGETSPSFSRDDDIQRANIYREQDARDTKIRALLEKAKNEIENGNFTQPRSNNATRTYNAVLAISPNNVEAKQGLDYIISSFLRSGRNALEQNNKILAENALAKLSAIDRNSDEYLELQTAIKSWAQERRLNALLINAKSAYGKRALILPARENALYYYQQALLIDENNLIAKAGVQKIADSYIQFANDAVLNGQFETAATHLVTVNTIDSSHSSIPLIEAMIARAPSPAEKALAEGDNNVEISSNGPQIESQEIRARTSEQQTAEQEAFDRQYLKQGLESYYNGEYEVASALLQPLADKGIARAQFKLAYMHFLGRGFRQDRAVADKMIQSTLPAIEKFADDGRAWAQSDLGNLYQDGLVLPRSNTSAVYWYRAAAEQGYPEAQTNLGIMYARGLGVRSSRRTAIGWFQLAAKQGDIIAQKNLETMGVSW